MNEAQLRFGLLGCGFFGRALADGIGRLPGARLVAVADVTAEAAAAVAEATGAAAVAPDELLAGDGVDAVLVATPNHTHREPVLRALAAGRAVFVEKPMALDPADCAAMTAAAESAGVPLVVGHILRTLPAVRRIRELLDAGELGDVVAARGSLARWMESDADVAGWWKRDPALTGGELKHEIHVLDLLCWLLGDPSDVVGASTAGVTELVLRYPGCLATYELSTVHRRASWGLVVHGTAGTAALDLRAGTLTVLTEDGERVSGVFDEPEADDSLRSSATQPQRYNRAGGATPHWMARAIDLELAETLAVFRGATSSPLSEAPARAVEVADRFLAATA
jgi:predicted dehydrogenase